MATTIHDPSFLALALEVAEFGAAKGVDQLIDSLHRAAWKFNRTYSPFHLPYRTHNPIGPSAKGTVEELVRLVADALRTWCPLGTLTQHQLGRLNSSLLLMQSAFIPTGFEVQAAIQDELEFLEMSYEASVLLSHEPGWLARMTLQQLFEHKSILVRTSDRLLNCHVQAAIDQRSRPSAKGRLSIPSTVERVTSPATYAPL
jgi:hypothetical protein